MAKVTPFPKLSSPTRKNPRVGGFRTGGGGYRTTQRPRVLKREGEIPRARRRTGESEFTGWVGDVGSKELAKGGWQRIAPIEAGGPGRWYKAAHPKSGWPTVMLRLGKGEWVAFNRLVTGVGSTPTRAVNGKKIQRTYLSAIRRALQHAPDQIMRYESVKEILSGAATNPKRRKNPVKRDAKSGKKLPDVTKNMKRFRVRGPQRFVKDSFKTISLAWAKSSMKVDSAFALSKARKYKGFPRNLSPNTQVVVGQFTATAKGDRPKGVKGQYLAWGIQTILVPKPASKRKAPAKKKATKKTATRRSNPGPRLMVMNPMPKHIETFRKKLTPAERTEFDTALRRYIKFHGGAFPAKISKVGSAPGKGKRFLVGMGRAVDVGYKADKRFPKSNKKGTAWRHEFKTKNAIMATTANGKQILVLNKPGARKGFKVTDWVRG